MISHGAVAAAKHEDGAARGSEHGEGYGEKGEVVPGQHREKSRNEQLEQERREGDQEQADHETALFPA